MATIITGIQTGQLQWQLVLVGVFIAIVIELCGIKALSFAIGIYLPLATTLPIFIGAGIRGLVDWRNKKKQVHLNAEEEELGKGSLFATGLVAGGALAGVIVAFMLSNDNILKRLESVSTKAGLQSALGEDGYKLLGVAFFALMGFILFKLASSRAKN
ncbi:MAG: hypothetical protein ABS85_03070 [Sphingobacteriales bacterium SCN 48-20]|nr:MAG: hypothetical protein ABS85_03070 [Sphingobacteriales bacterium SCN 48-20]